MWLRLYYFISTQDYERTQSDHNVFSSAISFCRPQIDYVMNVFDEHVFVT